ncbi:glycosyltransferase family 4 protein [Bacillus sp. ISL-45]|uniref:glycosyltransferase family 4 protein n=1 Tax=Bacillus sp. ISL-45 TaxID=2819128 RepID=UPI001BE63C22|nr:glycosyltransferase family 4 protein [Bacillus sp. ISL-45]MBT2661600.1 glycosyltransferase family 4 protein [Bacillus sp. ISL-45]
MKKILLYDASNSGHHFFYNYTVLKSLRRYNDKLDITFVSPVTEQAQISKISTLNVKLINNAEYFYAKNNKVISFLRYAKILNLIRKEKIDIIHFLYLDSEILNMFILRRFTLFTKVMGTLHWYPSNTKKRYMISSLINNKILNTIIVHGEYTKNKIFRHSNTSKVHSITYPNFHGNSYEMITSKYEKIRLLAFGGLRFDKGIDLLIKSLENVSHDYELLIAGQEDYFTKSDLENLIKERGIESKVKMDLRYLSDKELDDYFNKSDIVVLPYRRYFSGQSGPLTEGVARNKIILGPNTGEVGFTIDKYNLGRTFVPEDIDDLAKEIKYLIENFREQKESLLPYQEDYKKLLSIDTFINSYISIYNETLTSLEDKE